ncbi:ribose-phosphate pyrophosphokinase [Trinickia caryophylli]|uniref:ribose-phosphate diphosphokinase n=1 Tax=Trinickia caryophylli TaxID=28094 RepID=A0A1X7D230_TRICW|nr:ribose-phosphate pyrophosphokinase [Trinickia caryophylli]PMS13567.1 ribose-phosphate pyrophosphokinase [Trinickia caryophylli]TRX15265.1 ribose-phosphate pyrophosphokinase [Trinickia caryophylli]WQE15141.1 ribose-phosphate pyrophosphokinase [Trinickia caryophylli]SMF06738.1 ribose-phosphate pyrophosphokinase [Trinickia caryophylli]GLU31122.1 ribose-phosphate pyrophosphokinase [Trinickia caryophylli]
MTAPAADPLLFALAATRSFGESVSHRLGTPLAPLEARAFEDGEHKTRPLTNVRGRDVFVIQSLYTDERESVNDKLCELLFFIGALKDASAASVTAVVPYLAYARKDRKSQSRDPVTTRYVAGLFEAVGTDRIVTIDVHNLAAYQNAFRCRTDHLEANPLFVEHFLPIVDDDEVVVVSPDAGGIKRAEAFRQRLTRALGRPVAAAFAEKHRSAGVVTGELIVGDVANRRAIVIDDMISTGTTIARTVKACRSLGAREVYAVATHGLFVGDAASILADDALTQIVVTDSVPPSRLPAGKVRDKLAVLDSSGLFAAAIRCIHSGESIAALLDT